ncbi:MAG: hypothetical protein JNN09_03430 [Alphaproteobacteria bacterium]|nr:hypothetical protein [Alphaproteobacteria bacterium]
MIDESVKFSFLCSHYKDTYDLHHDARKCRDSLFFGLLCILCLFVMQFFSEATELLDAYVTKQIGISLKDFDGFLSLLLWFMLMGWGIKYFQINVTIERQYDYLHALEKEIKTYYPPASLAYTREGVSYLRKYPLFSNWLHFLYTSVFPIFLIATCTIELFYEYWVEHRFWKVGVICYVMITVSTILYMFRLHNSEPKFLLPLKKFLDTP